MENNELNTVEVKTSNDVIDDPNSELKGFLWIVVILTGIALLIGGFIALCNVVSAVPASTILLFGIFMVLLNKR